MPKVSVGENEPLEKALRRFKKKIEIEGIPKDNLDKIFDPFFTTKRNQGGTGLGLSVVKSIIEMHNGKITIRNKEEGAGARVNLTFRV